MKSSVFFPGVEPAPKDPEGRQLLIKWLISHPLWSGEEDLEFDGCVDIDFLPYVNPTTGVADQDPAKNSVMAIRIEAGQSRTHDRRLDFWAPTLEVALLELAKRVDFFFDEQGTERIAAPQPCALRCEEFSNGHCTKCGFIGGWWNYWMRPW